jgi:hypothetical protein
MTKPSGIFHDIPLKPGLEGAGLDLGTDIIVSNMV